MLDSLAVDRIANSGVCRGTYKQVPEDFVVSEELPFQPEGTGEHVYLRIQKRGHNTAALQQQLARFAGIARHKVGYAGLKDRQAVSSQWFSVHLPGFAEPDWSLLQQDGIVIEHIDRHPRKLRPGMHSGNHFNMVLRDLEADGSLLDSRLQALKEQGFPNYFGEQRFGRGDSNMLAASDLGVIRKGRFSQRQAMALSAARAYLFNRVLAQRERQGNWNALIAGDLVNLDGSNSFFGPIEEYASLHTRLLELEIHPTGPLAGIEPSLAKADALALEESVMAAEPGPLAVVHRLQARSARRPLRARVKALEWHWLSPRTVRLEISLGRGVYATSLLQALGDFRLADSA